MVGKGLDVVADHLLGAVKVSRLRNPYVLDVQFPAVHPPLGAHAVDAHCSHPFGRQASLAMVSRTTPGDTMRASVITPMCLPQGQYHLMWSPLPSFGVQRLACSARAMSR